MGFLDKLLGRPEAAPPEVPWDKVAGISAAPSPWYQRLFEAAKDTSADLGNSFFGGQAAPSNAGSAGKAIHDMITDAPASLADTLVRNLSPTGADSYHGMPNVVGLYDELVGDPTREQAKLAADPRLSTTERVGHYAAGAVPGLSMMAPGFTYEADGTDPDLQHGRVGVNALATLLGAKEAAHGMAEQARGGSPGPGMTYDRSRAAPPVNEQLLKAAESVSDPDMIPGTAPGPAPFDISKFVEDAGKEADVRFDESLRQPSTRQSASLTQPKIGKVMSDNPASIPPQIRQLQIKPETSFSQELAKNAPDTPVVSDPGMTPSGTMVNPVDQAAKVSDPSILEGGENPGQYSHLEFGNGLPMAEWDKANQARHAELDAKYGKPEPVPRLNFDTPDPLEVSDPSIPKARKPLARSPFLH